MKFLLDMDYQNDIPNKYSLNVEELACESCRAVTGHVLTGKHWTCVHCSYQQGKEKTFLKEFWSDIKYAIFKR